MGYLERQASFPNRAFLLNNEPDYHNLSSAGMELFVCDKSMFESFHFCSVPWSMRKLDGNIFNIFSSLVKK